ncbi:hypothetical protein ACIBG0_40145 [Nocardia sp. NPDC050630]|uniref:hypothetical protein n=1 Tax=Nocardia sp. NPDC050630 TaxID=3364321 RepID=UPI00379C9780
MSQPQNRRRRRPARPAGAPAPQDFHEARKSPAQREAEGAETVSFVWRGVELTVIADPQKWHPVTVWAPLSQNNVIGGTVALLGSVQLARLAANVEDFEAAHYYEIFNEISRVTGFGRAGN